MKRPLEDVLALMSGADRTPVVARLPRPLYRRIKALLKARRITWTDFVTLSVTELADRLEATEPAKPDQT